MVALPPGLPPVGPAVLDKVHRNYMDRPGREVMQRDLAAVTRWEDHQVLRLFRYLETKGLAEVILAVYHRQSGQFLGRYRLSDGPPIPCVVRDDEGVPFEITSPDELEYDVIARLTSEIVFFEGADGS